MGSKKKRKRKLRKAIKLWPNRNYLDSLYNRYVDKNSFESSNGIEEILANTGKKETK